MRTCRVDDILVDIDNATNDALIYDSEAVVVWH